MKKKALINYAIIFIMFIVLVASNNLVKSAIDYSANESYYQKLCNKQSSYNANKSVCVGFEKYLQEQANASKSAAKNIKDDIAKNKGDIEKLIGLIQENAKYIEQKKIDIERTKEDIKHKEEEIQVLEKDIMDRLALMQEMTSENFTIDFIMSSTSLEDFLTKMDGIDAINKANNEAITDLDSVRKKLNDKKVELENSKKELEESQKQQNQMLKDYRAKEAELFTKLEAEQKKSAVYNSKLNNLNINDVTGGAASKGFVKPVSHAVVTATAWYYPASFGGGWHPGVDLANNTGTPILAPANGVILATGSNGGGGYGNFLITAHQMGNDVYTFIYGHLNSYAGVSSTIKQGQTMAYMGSTGFSTGPHLHFEVFRHRGRSLQSVINEYRSNGDIYFGLGYASTGSCSNVCRIKPHEFLGVSYGQSF